MICDCFSSLFFSAARQWTDNIIHIPKTTNIPANSTADLFLLLSILFSSNHQVITPKKMHCLSRQCILNIAAGCHFTDPIALRLSLSTDLPTNLFWYYIVHFSSDLSIINISSWLGQECSYQQALQHEHSFQQKEPFVHLLRKHWQSSQ